MKSFKEYQSIRRDLLQEHLITFLDEQSKKISDDFYHAAIQRIKDFSTNGKMLRGVFAMFSYEMFNGKIDSNILDVAAVMELSQTALLIHDDIIDNGMLRRGQKTIHAQYMHDAIKHDISKTESYGKSMAIVVGDISIFLTYKLIGRLTVSGNIHSQLMNIYSDEMCKVGVGELMDIHYGKTTHERSNTEILRMYNLKTGAYTFTLPFLLGALMAHASEEDCKILEQITGALGTVFQIRDDELGLFGETEITGKHVGADLAENKKTMLISLLKERANESEIEKLNSIIGSSVNQADLSYVRNLMTVYGIRDELNKTVMSLSEMADKGIEKLSIDPEFRALFRQFVVYNSSRGQ